MAAELHEPMATKPARARQNGQGHLAKYNQAFRHRISGPFLLKRRHRIVQRNGMAHNTRSCISGNWSYASNRVRSFSILHSYCIARLLWGTNTIPPCHERGMTGMNWPWAFKAQRDQLFAGWVPQEARGLNLLRSAQPWVIVPTALYSLSTSTRGKSVPENRQCLKN